MSSSSNAADPNENDSTKQQRRRRTIRILALHGSEGNAVNFAKRLEPWQILAAAAAQEKDGTAAAVAAAVDFDLQITTINAPVPKGNGFAWWSMPPYVRSYNATSYEFFNESATAVLHELDKHNNDNKSKNGNNNEPFDFVLGFSQGAILLASLLALKTITIQQPKLGFILIGGAWPNPFTKEMESLSGLGGSNGGGGGTNVLIVAGKQDSINPPEQSERIKEALQAGGCNVTMASFDGGHVVPTTTTTTTTSTANTTGTDGENDTSTLQDILAWVASKVS